MKRVHVIDSHTAGEPTRLVLDGFPALSGSTVAEKLNDLRENHDAWRRATVLEPRGNDVLVGALLCEATTPDSLCGVIFFNNSGYLGMCGHATMGLVASLAHIGKITSGIHKIDTPVGTVTVQLDEDGAVTVHNVPSYRFRREVEVTLPEHGIVKGDIAWGGNWFFLISDHGQQLSLENVDALTEYTWSVRQALIQQNIQGECGGDIDHIELFAKGNNADSRNFVLCPGKAYDRSPCGTGTSAKLACLAADGALPPGHTWRQEGICGGIFEASYTQEGNDLIPSIKGHAYISAESILVIDDNDPFAWGIHH